MEISSSFSLQGPAAVRGAGAQRSSGSTAQSGAEPSSSVQDILDLSSEALSQTQATPSEIRVDKIAALRRAIADGSYDTPEKISVALDRFLDQRG